MRRVIVRYKVKADRADENISFIKKVFSELKETAPQGLRYASFIGADGVSFVHVASIESPDGSTPLATLAAFKAFQAEIKDRCEEPPQALEVSIVGSYGMLEE
jgi:hypothetical protein